MRKQSEANLRIPRTIYERIEKLSKTNGIKLPVKAKAAMMLEQACTIEEKAREYEGQR
jgi:hypothetical protein